MTSASHRSTSRQIRRRVLPGLALTLTFVLAACSSSGGNPVPPPSTSSTTESPSPTHSPKSNQGGSLPLGTFTLTSGSASCAETGDCSLGFQVDCPGVQQPAEGTLIASGSGSQPKGMILATVGTLGVGTLGLSKQWLDAMVADGFEVIIISWSRQSPWLSSAPGEEVGPKLLACRPATAIQWIHDNVFDKLGLPSKGKGVCGFCITGNSGGASQIAYALSFYGAGSLLDAAVMTSGPPHTVLDEACLGPDPNLQFDPDSAGIVDLSYGFSRGRGPCVQHDQSFADTWKKDSADVGGKYSFPDTRIVFLFVDGDQTAAPPHGRLYEDKVRAAGTPDVTENTVTGTIHTIMSIPEGRQAVEDALISGS